MFSRKISGYLNKRCLIEEWTLFSRSASESRVSIVLTSIWYKHLSQEWPGSTRKSAGLTLSFRRRRAFLISSFSRICWTCHQTSNTDGGFTGLSLPRSLFTGKPFGQCLMQTCGFVFSSDIDFSLAKGMAFIQRLRSSNFVSGGSPNNRIFSPLFMLLFFCRST